MDHTGWCDQTEHEDRETHEQHAHPDDPDWTGCVGEIHSLDVGGITLTGNLIETDPGDVIAVVEVSKDGKLVPASFRLDVADAATALAWVAAVLGQADTREPAVA